MKKFNINDIDLKLKNELNELEIQEQIVHNQVIKNIELLNNNEYLKILTNPNFKFKCIELDEIEQKLIKLEIEILWKNNQNNQEGSSLPPKWNEEDEKKFYKMIKNISIMLDELYEIKSNINKISNELVNKKSSFEFTISNVPLEFEPHRICEDYNECFSIKNMNHFREYHDYGFGRGQWGGIKQTTPELTRNLNECKDYLNDQFTILQKILKCLEDIKKFINTDNKNIDFEKWINLFEQMETLKSYFQQFLGFKLK